MPRYKLTIAYVGTHYHGWQLQDKIPQPPTIQGALETVFSGVVGSLVRVHGAGRTDSGVHAEGQVAHIDLPQNKADLDWLRICNTSLAHDIRVLAIEAVHDSFHARFDAVDKTYVYQFWLERRWVMPRAYPFVWDCGPLDVQRMHTALPLLMGTHDFASMQNTGTPIQDTQRTIHNITLTRETETLLTLTITANGFLKQMVRNIAGLLAAVGQHKYDADAIAQLLLSKNRRLAPPTAPARGLTLQHISYPFLQKL